MTVPIESERRSSVEGGSLPAHIRPEGRATDAEAGRWAARRGQGGINVAREDGDLA